MFKVEKILTGGRCSLKVDDGAIITLENDEKIDGRVEELHDEYLILDISEKYIKNSKEIKLSDIKDLERFQIFRSNKV